MARQREKSYLWVVGILGAGLCVLAISRGQGGILPMLRPQYLALLVTFVVTDIYRTPLKDGYSGSFGLAPVVAALLLIGTEGAILLNLAVMVGWVVRRRRWLSSFYTMGSMVISTALGCYAGRGLAGPFDGPQAVLSLVTFASVYFGISAALSGIYGILSPTNSTLHEKMHNLSHYFIHTGYSSAFGALMANTHQIAGEPLFYVSCAIVSVTAVLISKSGHKAVSNEREYERAKALAATDPLTGLYNYGQFQTALEDALQGAAKTQGVVSLIYVDLDGFREINNTYGHQSGDDTLKLVADVLRSSCREKDSISRPGGDEFTVILPGASKAEAYGVVKRISASLLGVKVKSKTVGELPLALRASYGVATFPEDGHDAATIVKRADDELYLNKNIK